jgi:hypothetical protein
MISLVEFLREDAEIAEGGDCPNEAQMLREAAEIIGKLPKDSHGNPIVPGQHRWVVGGAPEHNWSVPDETIQEVVVEGIGNDSTILVGGLPGVDDDLWEVYGEELYESREAAEAAKGK